MRMPQPPKRQFYTDAELTILRAALERLIDTYGTQTHAAKQLGIAQGTVSSFLKGIHGVTPAVARRIAQLSGTTVPQMLGWADGGPRTVDRYANRTVAIQMARLAGLGEDVIECLERVRLDDDVVDMPVLWWFDKCRGG